MAETDAAARAGDARMIPSTTGAAMREFLIELLGPIGAVIAGIIFGDDDLP